MKAVFVTHTPLTKRRHCCWRKRPEQDRTPATLQRCGGGGGEEEVVEEEEENEIHGWGAGLQELGQYVCQCGCVL